MLDFAPLNYSLALAEHVHGIKGFVIPTKSFVKIGIKIFCYNNKMFNSINKTCGCCSKFLVAGTKMLFVVPNFAAVTKPFFFVYAHSSEILNEPCEISKNGSRPSNK